MADSKYVVLARFDDKTDQKLRALQVCTGIIPTSALPN